MLTEFEGLGKGADDDMGLTLPLSGRQMAWGGTAESKWRPVHSRGLFEESFGIINLSPQALCVNTCIAMKILSIRAPRWTRLA
jgi:hypothetical protein